MSASVRARRRRKGRVSSAIERRGWNRRRSIGNEENVDRSRFSFRLFDRTDTNARLRRARSGPRARGARCGLEAASRRVAWRRSEKPIDARAFRDAPSPLDAHRSRRTRRTTSACREWASPRTGRTSDTARGLAGTARTSRGPHSDAGAKRVGLDYPPTNRARLRCRKARGALPRQTRHFGT